MIEDTHISTGTKAEFVHTNGSQIIESVRCPQCQIVLHIQRLKENNKVCPHCDYHFRLTASERIHSLLDVGSFVELEEQMQSADPLPFRSHAQSYTDKIREEQERTGLTEAVVVGTGRMNGHLLALAVMDFRFIGGSMGSVVGEKITRVIEVAREQRMPLLIVTASGGARVQEGIFSLMQMAKTTIALQQLGAEGVPYISLLTHPTVGGVTSSFGMLGDIILAEPGASIGFAGPRVISQFTDQKLPKDAATAEFMLKHGMIDKVVPRALVRSTITYLLHAHTLRTMQPSYTPVFHHSTSSLQEKYGTENPWGHVRAARQYRRPHTADYIRLLTTGFFECKGDRRYADDTTIMGGIATFLGRSFVFIGHQKGHDVQQQKQYNFGMPHPEGYRKAQRLMRYAEKMSLPIITFIDTPGAFPGFAAEQRGQAQAIAETLATMSMLKVPTVAVIIGEGGSGGALALGIADRVFMLEQSVYTVVSPEAAAAILWRNDKLAPQAAAAMRITAQDLQELGIIDGIIPEPTGGAQFDHGAMSQMLAEYLYQALTELLTLPIQALLEQRHAKFRRIGHVL